MPCPKPLPGREYALFEGSDVKVTSSMPNQSRSESIVVANPTNPQNLICASKKFIEPQKYHFTISASFSMDGGQNWIESQPALQPGWDGMTDPDMTFDALGNAYLIVEPLQFGTDLTTIGIYVYKSTDGGQTWGKPVHLHTNSLDDKQWIDADTNPASPHYGAVYAVWGANTPLRFARSFDQGATWQGMGGLTSGSDVSSDLCFAPSLAVSQDGTIHVSWHVPGTSQIMYTRSTDGGNSFSVVASVVTGVKSLTNSLPSTAGFPHFVNGTFRVMTLVTSCIAAGNRLIIAWADFREGQSRIYYRIANNGGAVWLGPADGEALLPAYGRPDQQHFHPQLAVSANEAVGCVFYEYGPKKTKPLIDVIISFSCNDGNGFSDPIVATDQPWDPAVNAPWSHGNPAITFIGEYFGFIGLYDSFAAVWTDTRTGVQELFYDRITLKAVPIPVHIPIEVATILAGVTQDGGGIIFVGGKIIRIPPWDPQIDILHTLAAMDSVKEVGNPGAKRAMSALRQIIGAVVRE